MCVCARAVYDAGTRRRTSEEATFRSEPQQRRRLHAKWPRRARANNANISVSIEDAAEAQEQAGIKEASRWGKRADVVLFREGKRR